MPSFLDKLKIGAEKAAFEADRMVRVNQAKSVLRGLQREMASLVESMGTQALELYDAGTLTQPELLTTCASVDELREKIQAQEAEVERIRQEEAPSPDAEEPEEAPVVLGKQASETPAATSEGITCTNCNSPIPDDARFCQECGAPVEDA